MFSCLKNLIWVIIPAQLIFAADTTNTGQQEIAYGFENDFVHRYIWRGISYNEGLLSQPYLWFSISGFTLGLWGNITANDVNSVPGHEVDFSAEYLFEKDEWTLQPSVAYYTYPGQEEASPTAEGSLKISYKIFESEIYSNFTADIIEYPGSVCADLGIMHEIYLSDEITLEADLNTGWASKKFNSYYLGDTDQQSSLNYINSSLSAYYYLTDIFYIRPHLEYYYMLSDILKSVSGNGLFNFGFAAGVEF